MPKGAGLVNINLENADLYTCLARFFDGANGRYVWSISGPKSHQNL